MVYLNFWHESLDPYKQLETFHFEIKAFEETFGLTSKAIGYLKNVFILTF